MVARGGSGQLRGAVWASAVCVWVCVLFLGDSFKGCSPLLNTSVAHPMLRAHLPSLTLASSSRASSSHTRSLIVLMQVTESRFGPFAYIGKSSAEDDPCRTKTWYRSHDCLQGRTDRCSLSLTHTRKGKEKKKTTIHSRWLLAGSLDLTPDTRIVPRGVPRQA